MPLTISSSQGGDPHYLGHLILTGAMAGFAFPEVRLRLSASNGGLSDNRNAYFGYQNTRTSGSSRADESVKDVNALLDGNVANLSNYSMAGDGNYQASYIFTMNDLVAGTNNSGYYYKSGSYKDGDAASIKSGGTYKTVLNAGYEVHITTCWRIDGFDIRPRSSLQRWYDFGN